MHFFAMLHKKLIQKKFVIPMAIVFGIGVAGGGLYAVAEYQRTQDLLKNPTLAAQVEAQSVVGNLGKMMELPKDEQPTIATVSDVSKLKGQTFFKNAKNGHKVLIYSKSKKAILYDAKNNKIIEVSTLNIAQPSPSTPVGTSAATLRVALYNGTTTVGLTSKVEKKLQAQMKNMQVVTKENAKSSTYSGTTVIDVSGKNSLQASQLAKALKAKVGTLPMGEVKPAGADIIVILGPQH